LSVDRVKKILQHDLVRRSALFTLPVIAATLVSLVSIPVIMRHVGAEAWGLLAVLQGACLAFNLLVGLGWGATGPSMVSGLPAHERKSAYVQSLRIRAVALAVVTPVAVVTCAALTELPVLTATLAVLTYVTPAANASWYLIGTNRPLALFAFDGAPAMLGQVSGLLAVARFGTLDAYLLGTALFTVVGVLGSSIYVLLRREDGPLLGARQPWKQALKTQVPGFAAAAAWTAWSALPIVLVRLIAPAGVPIFGMADRFLKFGGIALGPILQAVQGWLPEAGASSIRARARQALLVAAGLGVAGGGLITLLAPLASSLLSGGAIVLGLGMAALVGVAFLFDSVSHVTGLAVLAAMRAQRALGASSALLIVVGLPLVSAMTAAFGAIGAVGGMALVSIGMAALRVSIAVRRLRVTQDDSVAGAAR
jgi:O-antigen/teichoic acid export membrane protein